MAGLLRLMALTWALIGLMHFYIAPAAEIPAGVEFLVDPTFNAYLFLSSSFLLILISQIVNRYVKKTRKPSITDSIDPANEIKLRELRALRGRGLIGGKEYKQKRQDIIQGL